VVVLSGSGDGEQHQREAKGKEEADEHQEAEEDVERRERREGRAKEAHEREAEGEPAEALDWKVRQLVDATIGTCDHIKSALTEFFDEDRLDSSAPLPSLCA
jgi:hypothetical protein